MARQTAFPPLLCAPCARELVAHAERKRLWRKALGRGREPSAPMPCGAVLGGDHPCMPHPDGDCPCGVGAPGTHRCCGADSSEKPCCLEIAAAHPRCGIRHGHPSDEEEQKTFVMFDTVIYGPPYSDTGKPLLYRGFPTAPCAVCEERATAYFDRHDGASFPVCRSCETDLRTHQERHQARQEVTG